LPSSNEGFGMIYRTMKPLPVGKYTQPPKPGVVRNPGSDVQKVELNEHPAGCRIAPEELRLLVVFFRDGFLGAAAIESHVGQEQQPIVLLPGS